MRHFLTAALLVFGLCAPAPAAMSRTQQADVDMTATVRKAEKLARRYDHYEAIRLLETSLEATGWKSFDAFRLLARLHLALMHDAKAIAAANSMVQVAEGPERQGEAYSRLGVALYQSSYSRTRRPFLDQAIGKALVQSAETWLKDKTFPIEVFEQAAEIAREREPLWPSRSAMLEDAVLALRRAIELRSVPLDGYHLAEALARLGREDEAAARLNEYFERVGAADVPRGPRELQCWLELEGPGGEGIDDASRRTAPRQTVTKQPRYTAAAKRHRMRGRIIMQGVVDEHGDVRCIRPLRGLPMGMTERAVEAVEEWKFEPATLDGQPIAVRYDLILDFQRRYGRPSPVFHVR